MNIFQRVDKIKELIDEKEFDQSLNKITEIVHEYCNNQSAQCFIYGSKLLDQTCQKVGKEIFSTLTKSKANKESDKQTIYYLATELYMTGGHSAVIEDCIHALPEYDHTIIATNLYGHTEQEDILNNRFGKYCKDILIAPAKSTFQAKTEWLMKLILDIDNENPIVLFNHHADSITAAACIKEIHSNFYFYHHADCSLALGVYLSHMEHIDCTPYMFHQCNRMKISKTTYLSFANTRKNELPTKANFGTSGSLNTCSTGSANKFVDDEYRYQYHNIVPSIIEATGGRHLHIGYLPPKYVAKIHSGLKDKGISIDKFHHLGHVKSIGKAMLDNNIDIYINSFPQSGGMALMEVMQIGLPIIGHNNHFNAQFSAKSLMYPEAFFWSHPEELYQHIKAISTEEIKEQSQYAQAFYKEAYSKELLKSNLQKILFSKDKQVLPIHHTEDILDENYDLEKIFIFNKMNRELDLKGEIKRRLKKLERSISQFTKRYI